MASRLNLNTNVSDESDLQRRYSYLSTPIEYQAPSFGPSSTSREHQQQQEQRAAHLSVVPESPPPPVSQTLSHNSNNTGTLNSPSVTYISSAADQNLRSPQTSPTFVHVQQPPPISQHPANFAPYANDPVIQGQPENVIRHPQLAAFPSPPLSPGPLPPKRTTTAEAQEQRETELGVVPDTNLLGSQSPNPLPNSPTPGRSVPSLGHFPGQVVHPEQIVRGGTWNHGLCDCRDVGICCTGIWCPCILYGRTQYRLSQRSEKKDPTNLLGYETCNAQCTAMALLCGFQCMLLPLPITTYQLEYLDFLSIFTGGFQNGELTLSKI